MQEFQFGPSLICSQCGNRCSSHCPDHLGRIWCPRCHDIEVAKYAEPKPLEVTQVTGSTSGSSSGTVTSTITVTASRAHINTEGFGFNTVHRQAAQADWQWHEAVADMIASHHAQVMGHFFQCEADKQAQAH